MKKICQHVFVHFYIPLFGRDRERERERKREKEREIEIEIDR